VVAFGLASGFVEPLESTSIHMITTAAVRLRISSRSTASTHHVDHYNELSRYEIERIRDFVCMHYHYNQARRHARSGALQQDGDPGVAAQRVELFSKGG
jgi:tryptophan halogenase